MNKALPSITISLTDEVAATPSRVETIAIGGQNAENARLSNLCGEQHQHIKTIEQEIGVTIYQQGKEFVIEGESDKAEKAGIVLQRLYQMTRKQAYIENKHIHQVIRQMSETAEQISEFEQISAPLKKVVARSTAQSNYISAMAEYDVVFSVGPAGTGKTFLAVASAVDALIKQEVNRIVLVRPIVEAGEHLGFLPGDIGQKIDPYLRPLYDALYELLGFERVSRLIEKNEIELAPLAYMRGRTLGDAFVIMDEAQNTTVAQMKMLLTRIGFGSKVVITGDISQVDLPKGTFSGLKHALKVLHSVKGIQVTRFQSKDIVRHPLVQRIVDAYESSN